MFDNHKGDHDPGRAIVARFGSAAEARKAVSALHRAHYTHTWLGVTSVAITTGGEETLRVESAGGFFSETKSLVDALVAHGVIGDTARVIERDLEPGNALVTVDPKDRDVLEAISILHLHGGSVAGHTVDAASEIPHASSVSGMSTESDPARDFDAEDTFYRRSGIAH